jgi:hypothetical protein
MGPDLIIKFTKEGVWGQVLLFDVLHKVLFYLRLKTCPILVSVYFICMLILFACAPTQVRIYPRETSPQKTIPEKTSPEKTALVKPPLERPSAEKILMEKPLSEKTYDETVSDWKSY